jgi:trigger factor
VELLSADISAGAVLKAIVVVKPEMKLGKYLGLKATRNVKTADDTLVDAEIETLRQRNARILTREGVAEDGDIANIDYEGFVGGEPFAGGKDEGHRLTLGTGQFIPGFEEQVLGRRAGETFEVTLTFPEKYHSEELAGKPAVFKVKLNEVQMRELPAPDDEFAKDVSEYDTLKELKESIRVRLQAEFDEETDRDTENQLVEQIVEGMEGEIPREMYEARMQDMERDFAFRLEQRGMNLKAYRQYSGATASEFREGFRENAEKQVKMRLALETVVRLEGIVAADADIDAEVARIAEKYSMEPDKVRDLMPSGEIAKDLAVNKAIDLVKAKADIKEEKAEKNAEKNEGKAAKKESAANAQAEKSE